ncbi:MAG: hypothetical protein D4R67_07560 [Bacteroidetes bacterium]|nr:MAG: hypothetical protein D4R67_07560 [Bacteroidota bacterium]
MYNGQLLIIKSGTVVKFRTCEVHDMEKEGFSCGFLRVNGTILAEGKKSVMPQEGSLSMAPQVESQIA